jgi:chloramphenicol O-acetyltransferase
MKHAKPKCYKITGFSGGVYLMREAIDLAAYPKRNQYRWFSTFPDPTYGFDVDMDVNQFVLLVKERKESFFPYFLYFLTKGVNAIPEMHLRVVQGNLYRYEAIHPTWTVMTQSGVCLNVGMEAIEPFPAFYRAVKHPTPAKTPNLCPFPKFCETNIASKAAAIII